jgi:hypothetical protein
MLTVHHQELVLVHLSLAHTRACCTISCCASPQNLHLHARYHSRHLPAVVPLDLGVPAAHTRACCASPVACPHRLGHLSECPRAADLGVPTPAPGLQAAADAGTQRSGVLCAAIKTGNNKVHKQHAVRFTCGCLPCSMEHTRVSTKACTTEASHNDRNLIVLLVRLEAVLAHRTMRHFQGNTLRTWRSGQWGDR